MNEIMKMPLNLVIIGEDLNKEHINYSTERIGEIGKTAL